MAAALRSARFATLALTLAWLGIVPALAAGDWNDAGIRWMPYTAGLEAAKAEAKPICLVVYTDWCPHCTTYSRVFHAPEVVERAKAFVMIRLERDSNKEISARYAPDGDYIPRTLFLSREGKLAPEIHAPREQYVFFHDTKGPGSLLDGMARALETLK
jgi:hypothetical protein